MNVEEVLRDFRDENRNVGWAGEVLEREMHVTRRSSGDGRSCYVTAFEISDDVADSVIQGAIQNFGGKEFSATEDQLAEAVSACREGHEAYVAYAGSEPVAAGRLYTDPNSRFGGLYGGGTLPEYRGQGCYRAVVAARAKVAFARGTRYLVVDAMPTSHPILERLGFVKVAETTPCAWRGKP